MTNVNIFKFWIHLENKQDDHYAKQRLRMSLMKKVKSECTEKSSKPWPQLKT